MKENKVFKVKTAFKSANIPHTIRFTEEIYEKLQQIAVKKDMSFNLMVLECCKFALDNYAEDEEETQ